MIGFVLLLTVTLGGPSVPAADKIVCPGRDGAATTIADARLKHLHPAWAVSLHWQSTPTQFSDGVAYPAAGATWFPSHAGGSANGENVGYDAGGGMLLSCARFDTAMSFTAWLAPQSEVPAYVPRVHPAVPFATASGIGMGSTPQQIRALYGNAPLQPAGSGLQVLQYQKNDGGKYGATTTFVFKNGKLTGFYRIAGT